MREPPGAAQARYHRAVSAQTGNPMIHPKPGLATWSLLLLTAAHWPALAASSTASAVSQSVTTSVGSLSASLNQSSRSSTPGQNLADGDYRIVEVAALAEQPGMVELSLQALADAGPDGDYTLRLPQQALDRSGLAAGQLVSAHQRPYGIDFAVAPTQQAFFLVLRDDWYRELQSTPLSL